jgi:Flp pilus assembly pilin Flp
MRITWALFGALVLLLLGGWLMVAGQTGWLSAAFRSEMFVRFGLISIGCVGGLLLVTVALARMGRRLMRRRNLLADNRGTATLEFALLLPVALTVVLILIQSMLMMTATVVVNYAAFSAARAAIVWIPRDLAGVNGVDGYRPEPHNVLVDPTDGDSYKFERIKLAAAYACMPIAGVDDSGQGPDTMAKVVNGIRNEFESVGMEVPNWVGKLAGGKFGYAWQYTTVEFVNWTPTKGAVKERADVVVKVEHDYHLSVPFAANLFGQSSGHGYISKVSATYALSNEGLSDEILEDEF